MANKNRYDDLNTSAIGFAAVVSCIVLLLTILSVRALCSAWVEAEEERKLSNASYSSADDEISEQKSLLAGYDKREVEVAVPVEGQESLEAGEQTETKVEERIQIPISRAEELLISELGDGDNPST